MIVLDSEERNTAPPPGDLLDAWNLQGRIGGFNATPIGPRHYIVARHTGAGGTIDFRGQSYAGIGFTDIAGTDLRVWEIETQSGTRPFPAWAPIWNPAVDGSEIGQPLVVFGRGGARGRAVYAPIDPGLSLSPVERPSTPVVLTGSPASLASSFEATGAGPPAYTAGDLRGWQWTQQDGIQSWGQNVVDSEQEDDDYGHLIGFGFDADEDRVANEATLSAGDSGGGVFIRSGNIWKLAGVNLSVDGHFSGTEAGPYVPGAIFDARGLWIGTAGDHFRIPYSEDAVSASAYATRLSAYYGQLTTLTGVTNTSVNSGGGIVVPEPTTLLAVGAVAVVFGRRRKRVVPGSTHA